MNNLNKKKKKRERKMKTEMNWAELHSLFEEVMRRIDPDLSTKKLTWTFDVDDSDCFGSYEWSLNSDHSKVLKSEITIHLQYIEDKWDKSVLHNYTSAGEALVDTMAHELRHVWQLYFQTHESISLYSQAQKM